jgi:hypothetical protein
VFTSLLGLVIVSHLSPKGPGRFSAHLKRSRRVNRSAEPIEEKKRKKRLRRLSCLDQDAGPSASFLGDDLVDAIPEVNLDDAQTVGGLFDEDEEEKEEEIPLIRKNSCHYRGNDGGSDIPSQALSALVSLQGLCNALNLGGGRIFSSFFTHQIQALLSFLFSFRSFFPISKQYSDRCSCHV